MKFKNAYLIFGALAITALACSMNIQIPQVELQTGPTVTEYIQVDPPNSGEAAEVELVFGAGTLHIHPGNGPEILSGTLQYNVPSLKSALYESESQVRLSQGTIEIIGIPNFDDFINDWDLKLGNNPMRLEINAGAYEGDYDFGGLALHELRVIDGAAASHLRFSKPNLVEMDTLRYDTGASQVTLTGLGNANFEELVFKGGAGDFTLNFSGDLQRDAHIRIDSGLSNLRIIVPEGVNAVVNFQGGLAAIELLGGWWRAGGGYHLSGEGPTLTFEIELGAGALELISS